MIRVGLSLHFSLYVLLIDVYTREKTKGCCAQELVIILFILAIWLYSLYRLDEL
jgi:hypothetical protein